MNYRKVVRHSSPGHISLARGFHQKLTPTVPLLTFAGGISSDYFSLGLRSSTVFNVQQKLAFGGLATSRD